MGGPFHGKARQQAPTAAVAGKRVVESDRRAALAPSTVAARFGSPSRAVARQLSFAVSGWLALSQVLVFDTLGSKTINHRRSMLCAQRMDGAGLVEPARRGANRRGTNCEVGGHWPLHGRAQRPRCNGLVENTMQQLRHRCQQFSDVAVRVECLSDFVAAQAVGLRWCLRCPPVTWPVLQHRDAPRCRVPMAAAWLPREAVDLRKDEDVGQVIPEVEDELQVYVGLARAAIGGVPSPDRTRAAVVWQDTPLVSRCGTARVPARVAEWARVCIAGTEVELVIHSHVESGRDRLQPVEPVLVACDHDGHVRTPHHLARGHRPLAPHSVHHPDPAGRALVPVLVLVLELAACPSAAEPAHGWLPVEALAPQHARAEHLVELRSDAVHLRRTGLTAAAHAPKAVQRDAGIVV
eukprot:scaffold2253_cov69-Phaeocystis_antarctica.AAC.1